MVVSKQPSKPLSKRKTRDTLTEAEREAIIGQGIMVHGHKYKKNPLIHHPDSGNAINDFGTCAPPMHTCNGIVTAIIKMISPILPCMYSSQQKLAELLSSGRAPEAANISRRCAAFMATTVAARLSRQPPGDPYRPLTFILVLLGLFTQRIYTPSPFSMLNNFRLWMFGFWWWLTTADFSHVVRQKTASEPCTSQGFRASPSYGRGWRSYFCPGWESLNRSASPPSTS